MTEHDIIYVCGTCATSSDYLLGVPLVLRNEMLYINIQIINKYVI